VYTDETVVRNKTISSESGHTETQLEETYSKRRRRRRRRRNESEKK
jgi:hypothetical protein